MAKPPHYRPGHRSVRNPYGPHQTLRNPWLDGPGAPSSHGPGPGPGSHSSGSTTYDGYMPVYDQYAPEPPQLLRQLPATSATTPVYEVPDGGVQDVPVVCTLPHRNALHRCSDRPLTPGGLSQRSGDATECGECDALETWCYYCVQGVLGIAALAGLSLLIADAVLRGQPSRAAATANLSAMPYIGAMLALVAGALLLVQLFARNEKKRKKRRLQNLREQRAGTTGGGGTLRRPPGDVADLIPLQELHKHPPQAGHPILQPIPSGALQVPDHHTHQFQPLLARTAVGQHQQSRPQDIILPHTATPWWRRQPAHPGRAVYPS